MVVIAAAVVDRKSYSCSPTSTTATDEDDDDDDDDCVLLLLLLNPFVTNEDEFRRRRIELVGGVVGGAGAALFSSSSSFHPPNIKASLLRTNTTTMSNRQSISATTATSTPSYSNYSSLSSSSQQQQLCYDLLFTMWCMSLDCTCNKTHSNNGINDDDDEDTTTSAIRRSFIRDGAIPALVYLLKTMTSPREKVLRMTISCFKSLAISATTDATQLPTDNNMLSSSSSKNKNNNKSFTTTNDHIFIREMIGCGILPILYSMMNNQLSCWNDIDLQQDILFVYQLLTNYQSSHLTRWQTYLLELESGILGWNNSATTITTNNNNYGSTGSTNLIHSNSTDNNFFRSNAIYMEGTNYDFYPLQCLCNILYYRTSTSTTTTSSSSSSPSTVLVWDDDDMNNEELCESIAVCLYQIGEFILYYPGGNGRTIINHTIDNKGSSGGRNTKQLIMQYIYHPHLDIQQQALLCASKLLLRNNK